MPKLDSSTAAFREAGHRLVDWIGDYFDHPERYPVLSQVQPGDIERQIDPAAHDDGKPYEALLEEFVSKLLPGVTHWNHPAFFAYFSITGSQAGVLGELLTAALNANGMVWRTSPSLTELEIRVLAWLRQAMGLPPNLFGIINDTASINSFLGLAAAREKADPSIRRDGMNGRDLPVFRVYCSEHAHSSIDKAVIALGLGQNNLVKIASDDSLRMRVDALEEAIARDKAAGMKPIAIVATLGTTSSAAVDPLRKIGEVAARENAWLHVDAAYAGSATICPEFQWIWDGVEYADSIVTNPHKWLFTPIDCSVLYTKDPNTLRNAFTLAEVPAYLTLTDTADINYMDFGLQLGRRFRALKLWMVLEHYGLEHMRNVLRDHCAFAQRLANELRKRDDVELLAPPQFSVVVFRKKGTDEENQALIDKMNATGKLFVSHTKLRGKFGIRVAIGNGATEWSHVEELLRFL